MDINKIIMDLRVNHNLKGKYPALVFTMPNLGGVYNKGKRYFVVTYREKEKDLYFHGLSKWFYKYSSKYDFSLRIDKFKGYHVEYISTIGSAKFSLISYKDDFFPFGYFTGTRDSISSENNIGYICEELEKNGVKYTDNSTEYTKSKVKHGK